MGVIAAFPVIGAGTEPACGATWAGPAGNNGGLATTVLPLTEADKGKPAGTTAGVAGTAPAVPLMPGIAAGEATAVLCTVAAVAVLGCVAVRI